jgi:hypothetical protein
MVHGTNAKPGTATAGISYGADLGNLSWQRARPDAKAASNRSGTFNAEKHGS